MPANDKAAAGHEFALSLIIWQEGRDRLVEGSPLYAPSVRLPLSYLCLVKNTMSLPLFCAGAVTVITVYFGDGELYAMLLAV